MHDPQPPRCCQTLPGAAGAATVTGAGEPSIPDAASLRAAALHYVARYAATAAGVRRVLDRRIDRAARMAAGDADDTAAAVRSARAAAAAIVADLVRLGAIDDAAFAAARARRMARQGRSARMIAARLREGGVAPSIAAAVTGDAEADLTAALYLARRRRLGPFREAPAADGVAAREAAILARAGFDREVARHVLSMPAEEAAARLEAVRSGN